MKNSTFRDSIHQREALDKSHFNKATVNARNNVMLSLVPL